MEAIEQASTSRRVEPLDSAGSEPQLGWTFQHLGISTPPTLLEVLGKASASSAYDQARELTGSRPVLVDSPMTKAKVAAPPKSCEPATSEPGDLTSTPGRIVTALEKGRGKPSFAADFSTDAAAAQSEEYAGMVADSCGSSFNIGGRALLERVKRTGEEHREIILAYHESSIKKDLGVLPRESWSWTRHAYDEVIGHCGHFKSLRRSISMEAAALDEGRAGCLERQQALLCQIYTVCESAAKDPSHDLWWCWPVLGIRDPEGSHAALQWQRLDAHV